MKFPQQGFDTYQNAGLGVLQQRKVSVLNPPDSPFLPTADDAGCYAWSTDPADCLAAATTATASQVGNGTLLVVPNTVTVNRLSFSQHTLQGTETNYNGVGLYSLNAAFTTATLVASSANQAGWTGSTVDGITDAAFSAAVQLVPGYYLGVILGSTSTTAMTLNGTAGLTSLLNFAKNSAVTAKRSFTFGSALTALPATITMSAATAIGTIPFMAVS
jgi:hypothetical protein